MSFLSKQTWYFSNIRCCEMQSRSNYQVDRITFFFFLIEVFWWKTTFLLIFVEDKLWLNFPLLETLVSPFRSAISSHGWLLASMGMFPYRYRSSFIRFTGSPFVQSTELYYITARYKKVSAKTWRILRHFHDNTYFIFMVIATDQPRS